MTTGTVVVDSKKPKAREKEGLAVTVTAPRRAILAPSEKPAVLGPNEVRGSTVCSLVSAGTELAWNFEGKDFPNVPGYSAVFRAEEIGSEVTGVKVGDLLFCEGSHRSWQEKPAIDTLPVPEGLDSHHAVVARLMGVSMTTLKTTKARPGDIVLVTGMGPVGYGAAAIFAIAGYDVHAVEPDAQRRALVDRGFLKGIHSAMPLANGQLCEKVALVVDCSGHEQAVIDACKIVRRCGEVVLVGVPWKQRSDARAFDLLHPVFHKYVVLRTGWEWELPRHESVYSPHSIYSGFRLALEWLRAGKVPLEGLIEMHKPEEAQAVYEACSDHTTKGLFQVFDWERN